MARRSARPPRGRFGRMHRRPLSGPVQPDDAATTVPEHVGLDPAEAAEFLAICAAAERSSQPDRLPIAIALALAFLLALAVSGLPQRLWTEARDRGIERLIHRPDLKRGWSARVGATREDLGLQKRPDDVKPIRRSWEMW